MPLYDTRVIDTTRKGKRATSGRRSVIYRDANGNTYEGLVLSQGTSSGLKLNITSNDPQIVDNVPRATGLKQTGVYFSRTP